MRTLLIAALATLATAAPAVAAPLRSLVVARSPAFTDGERVAAFQIGDRSAAVLDDRGPRRTVLAPVECARPHLVAAGDGLLLWDCRPGTLEIAGGAQVHDLRVQRWRVGRSAPVAGQSEIPIGAGGALTTFDAVGGRWISGLHSGNRIVDRVFVDWRTGRHVFANAVDAPSLTFSLGAPALLTPVCRPLARRRTDAYDGPVHAPFAYDPPWGITATGERLLVMRCGGRTTSRRTREGTHHQLGGGVLSWTWGDRVRVERLESGRTWSWPEPPRARAGHTARTLYASSIVPGSPWPTERWRIRTARIPRG